MSSYGSRAWASDAGVVRVSLPRAFSSAMPPEWGNRSYGSGGWATGSGVVRRSRPEELYLSPSVRFPRWYLGDRR